MLNKGLLNLLMVKLVPYPPYGDDITGLGGILLYFFTKSVHVNHYCSVVSVVFKLPYQFKQLVIRKYPLGVLHQEGEKLKLFIGKGDRRAVHQNRAAGEVYFQAGISKYFVLPLGLAGYVLQEAPAQVRLYPGNQFAGVKGFDYVVVSTDAQAQHDI